MPVAYLIGTRCILDNRDSLWKSGTCGVVVLARGRPIPFPRKTANLALSPRIILWDGVDTRNDVANVTAGRKTHHEILYFGFSFVVFGVEYIVPRPHPLGLYVEAEAAVDGGGHFVLEARFGDGFEGVAGHWVVIFGAVPLASDSVVLGGLASNPRYAGARFSLHHGGCLRCSAGCPLPSVIFPVH